MSRLATWKWLVASWGANLRAAAEYRTAFALQAVGMALNNFVFLIFWAVFFARFESVDGWALRDIALLFGCGATSVGLGLVLFGGVFELPRRIAEGRLDTWLLRERPVLLQAAVSRMRLAGWGDFATGALLLVLAGQARPAQALAWAVVGLLGAIAFAAFGVLVSALAFWLGHADSIARQAIDAAITFALYPPSLFGGWAKVLLFVVLPAGFVGWLPAELVRDFRWSDLAGLAAGTAALSGVALLAWTLGLRRYESGNLTQAVD